MKRFIYFSLIILALTLSTFAQNWRVNRIYRPCPGSTTPASVTISVLGAVSITPCAGQTVTIDGVAFPSGGLTSGSVLFAGTGGAISQDNANFFWDNTNKHLLVGVSQTSVAGSSTVVSQFSLESASGTRFNLLNFGDGQQGPLYRGFKARGTAANPTAVLADDFLVSLEGGGFSPSAPTNVRSRLVFSAAENWTSSAQGAYLGLWLAAIGSTTFNQNQARIYSTGFHAASNFQLGWSSVSTQPATIDTGFARQSAGVIRATNGSTAIRGLIGGGANVASAAALPLPTGRVFHVTGTTNITSITSTNFASGACITIIFDDVLTFTDGNNLRLAGNFVTTADDTISLCYDGTNWFETGRSVN